MQEAKQTARRLPPSSQYVPAEFFLLRAPALSTHVFLQLAHLEAAPGPLSEGPEQQMDAVLTALEQQGYQQLTTLVSQADIEQALLVASQSLALEGLRHLQSGERTRRARRVAGSCLRYLIRMSTRPTPFGLFSGVATGVFTQETRAHLALPVIERIRSRPGMNWLLSLIQSIEQNAHLREHLHVMVNHAVYFVGSRAIIPSIDIYGQRDRRSMTLRLVPPVHYIIEHARQPLPYQELRSGLLMAFPNASEQQIDGLLHNLWECHFLISDLRPALTSPHPIEDVLEHLSLLKDATSLCTSFREVLATAREIDLHGPSPSLFRHLVNQQERLVPRTAQSPFQVDAALHLKTPHLSEAIGKASAQAAEALLALGPYPRGLPHLRAYQAAFLERYGPGAEVPLLELLSPEAGLDAPPTYTEPPREAPLPSQPVLSSPSAYEQRLCSLLVQAVNAQVMEVELTDHHMSQLASWNPTTDLPAPDYLEIYLQIQARDSEALDRGQWRAIVGPSALALGGRTFGRFYDLLDTEARRRLEASIRRQEMASPDVIFAELSYLPSLGRGANVAIRPAWYSYEIVVNTAPSLPPERVIPLDDLVVGVSANRFYIRSRKLGRLIQVCQSHLLNLHYAPNICRFLLEVGCDGSPVPAPFDWGSLRDSPFLPRLVRGNIVLSPAQWTLTSGSIEQVGKGESRTRWWTSLSQWREQWHVPRYVYLVEADNLLLLDLEHPLMAAELAAKLQKAGPEGAVRVQEMLPDFEHLWLRDTNNAAYLAELVVPLHRRQEASSRQDRPEEEGMHEKPFSSPLPAIESRDRRHLPGEEWAFLKLYAAAHQLDAIIAGPLLQLIRHLDERHLIDRWFYLRYTDPDLHLRIRFHAATPADQAPLLLAALEWARNLVAQGSARRLCVDTYEREIERYGGPKAIDAVEKLFAVDSLVTSGLVSSLYQKHLTLDLLAVAVLSLDHLFSAWQLTPHQRLTYLQHRTTTYGQADAFRVDRKLFYDLIAPALFEEYDQGPAELGQVRTLCAAQDPAVKEVAGQIRWLSASGELWRSEESILESLAHLHLNRLGVCSSEEEQNVYQVWRHALESCERRLAERARVSKEGAGEEQS